MTVAVLISIHPVRTARTTVSLIKIELYNAFLRMLLYMFVAIKNKFWDINLYNFEFWLPIIRALCIYVRMGVW
jgi:hypothetical protein